MHYDEFLNFNFWILIICYVYDSLLLFYGGRGDRRGGNSDDDPCLPA
jgi:hypothetical protein